MPKNTKAKGRNNEYRSVRWLAKYGYTRFMMSAASKGTFDLVCWNKYAGFFVQVKTNGLPPKEECLALMQAEVPPGCIKALFVWYDHQRNPEFWLISKTDMLRKDKAEYESILLSD